MQVDMREAQQPENKKKRSKRETDTEGGKGK